MASKPDRRQQRTRAALMKAFAQIMLADGYEAVSVERVCERANIGRSTFYLHFAGKEGILREALAGPSAQLVALVGADASAERVRPLLEHFHQQRKINAVCFGYPVRGLWVRRLAELIEPALKARAKAPHRRPVLPLAMIATQIAETQLALIYSWLANQPTMPAAVIAKVLLDATQAVMAALLGCQPALLNRDA